VSEMGFKSYCVKTWWVDHSLFIPDTKEKKKEKGDDNT
jgi:hypothetical protein